MDMDTHLWLVPDQTAGTAFARTVARRNSDMNPAEETQTRQHARGVRQSQQGSARFDCSGKSELRPDVCVLERQLGRSRH